MGINIDLDNDKKIDLNLDLKTIILIITGIISLTMTYSNLMKEIELAKTLPTQQEVDIEYITKDINTLNNKLKSIESKHNNRLVNLEKKVFKIR
jgi:ribosomal protein S15P/S13E